MLITSACLSDHQLTEVFLTLIAFYFPLVRRKGSVKQLYTIVHHILYIFFSNSMLLHTI